MKPKLYLSMLVVLLGAMLFSACGAPAATEAAYYEDFAAAATEAPAAMEAPMSADEFLAGQGGSVDAARQENAPVPENASYASNHMIIKNGDVRLQVEDTDVAIDRATQAIGDLGGYIVSSRVWYQDYY